MGRAGCLAMGTHIAIELLTHSWVCAIEKYDLAGVGQVRRHKVFVKNRFFNCPSATENRQLLCLRSVLFG
jgi:hypothetical protein